MKEVETFAPTKHVVIFSLFIIFSLFGCPGQKLRDLLRVDCIIIVHTDQKYNQVILTHMMAALFSCRHLKLARSIWVIVS